VCREYLPCRDGSGCATPVRLPETHGWFETLLVEVAANGPQQVVPPKAYVDRHGESIATPSERDCSDVRAKLERVAGVALMHLKGWHGDRHAMT